MFEWFIPKEGPPVASVDVRAPGGRQTVTIEASVRGAYVLLRGRVDHSRPHPLRRLGVSSREVCLRAFACSTSVP